MSRREKNRNWKYEVEGMKIVDSWHEELRKVTGNLNTKISEVLAKQESDFLAAYRAHMYSVQKELQALKARAVKAENDLQKNDKIQKLEEECDWYRKEALRLDECNTAFKKDLMYMKEKLETLEDDRNFLARQLKASKKHNKLLRAELDLTKNEQSDIIPTGGENSPYSAERSGSGGGVMLPDMRFSRSAPTALQTQNGVLNKVRRDHGYTSARPTTVPQNSGTQKYSSKSAPFIGGTGKSEDMYDNQEETEDISALKREIQYLKKQLAHERQQLARIRGSTMQQIEYNTLQDFLISCIKETQKEANRRKQKAMALSAKGRPKTTTFRQTATTMSGLDSPGRDPSKHWQPKTDLDDLIGTDRQSIMERLLLRDDVADLVYRYVFPNSDNSIAAKALTAGGITNDRETNQLLRRDSEMRHELENRLADEQMRERQHSTFSTKDGTPLGSPMGKLSLFPETRQFLEKV